MNEGWEHKISATIQDWTPLVAHNFFKVKSCAPDVTYRVITVLHLDCINVVQIKLADDDASLWWCAWPPSVEKPVFDAGGAAYHAVRSFTGGMINQPRKTLCYDHPYRYSGQLHPLESEIPASINQLYEFTNALFGVDTNMCLANGYFHGHHSISAHSDDERQMGDLHDVFCWVTGATRRAIFKTKKTKDASAQVVLDVEVPEGLYVMMGDSFQKDYTHEFPKIHDSALKHFFAAVAADGCPEGVTTMEKADWIWAHRDEVRDALGQYLNGKYLDTFVKWCQSRFSFTLRQFKEPAKKKTKV